MRKRIAAIDFGQTRIGLAVSDETQFLASPLCAIKTKPTMKETTQAILLALSEKEPIEKIILGLPLFLNGKDSPMSLKVRELAKTLEELSDKEVVLWDERLTTAQVERTLKEAEMKRKKRTQYLDAMAASAILQSYLDK
jgi:putative pre-16S rRNA nuclease